MKMSRFSVMFSLVMALLLFVNVNAYASTAESPENTGESLKLTEKFVAESEYSITSDSNGDPVITLTHLQQLYSNPQSIQNRYAKTSVAILPANSQEADAMINSIKDLKRGYGNWTEDDWFFAGSVYLASTVYYRSSEYPNTINYAYIEKITVYCEVNNGTTISSMNLLMGQTGYTYQNGYKYQTINYNAKTTRTFYKPSSWFDVQLSTTSIIGGTLNGVAVRPNGETCNFELGNDVMKPGL